MPAEDHGVEVLRLQAADFRHSCSNQLATRSVSALVCPTTWIPTGRPATGAGRTATGWCVVLNGLVKRVIGSPAGSGAPPYRACVPIFARRNGLPPLEQCEHVSAVLLG